MHLTMYTQYESFMPDHRVPHAQRFPYDHAEENMMPYLTGNEAPLYHPHPDHVMRELRPVVDSTAASKQLIFKTEPELDPHEWRTKQKYDWSESDVLHWIVSVSARANFPYDAVNSSGFNVDGSTLLKLSRSEFVRRDRQYGSILYDALHDFINMNEDEMYTTLTSDSSQPPLQSSPRYLHEEGHSEDNLFSFGRGTTSDQRESDSSDQSDSESSKPPPKPAKRPPGRPPGAKAKAKAEKKTGRLWEFIRDLLLNPKTCPSVISWEDHDAGVFRFVKSDEVAKIWGTRKNNEKMNYEKLSRAMRYYYKSKVLQPVLGRKLVYKFGPNARGWRCDNPNFRH